MMDWFRIEKVFLGPPYANKIKKGQLQMKINAVAFLMILASIGENFLKNYFKII